MEQPALMLRNTLIKKLSMSMPSWIPIPVMEHIMMPMNTWMEVFAMTLAHVSTLVEALIVSIHLVTKVIQNKEDV